MDYRSKDLIRNLVVIWGSALFLLTSCATTPVQPLASGELRLLRMDVQKEEIRESLPFVVNIHFEADGEPEIITVCFLWSGAGPYCSKIAGVTYGSPGMIRVKLLPRRTGPIVLEGYVVYKNEGKTESTNVVSERIRVIRPNP